jgi:sialate O-acetylesterase
MLAQKAAAIKNYDPEKAKKSYEAQVKKWKVADAKWQTEKKGRRPRHPRSPQHPALNPSMSSAIYNGMIAPIAGYGARGAIWYQGESNANPGTSLDYGELLKCLIQDWRKKWGSDLSFYYVQLANFERGGNDLPHWLIVQDEMRRLLDECDGVGMAVIHDIGDAKNIHPANKKDVGERLARWALSKDYGDKEIVVSGPLYKSHKVNAATVEVSFSHGVGMKSRDGEALGGFEVRDAIGNWQSAEATIKGEKVIVSSKIVTKPSNVRYAWKSNPTKANLVNAAGLPTSCFVGKK